MGAGEVGPGCEVGGEVGDTGEEVGPGCEVGGDTGEEVGPGCEVGPGDVMLCP